MNDDLYALWLSQIEDISFKKQLLLINAFPFAKAVFNATKYQLDSIIGISDADIKNIISAQDEKRIKLYEKELEESQIKFIGIKNEKYPSLLKQIPDPPIGLYFLGELPDDEIITIGVIGSRKSSDYGLNVAYDLSRDLAKNGAVVVSGMARGIDSMAHKGALDADGKTVAVLGCGVDICYPPENKALMGRIAENGCIISEYYPKTPPQPANFPRRNRIISGLCAGIVVVEASDKSGTLITTNHALEQGREVMAVPGNVTSNLSKGTNELIKDGAAVVLDYNDVMDAIGLKIPPPDSIKRNRSAKKSDPRQQMPDKIPDTEEVKEPLNLSDISPDEMFVYSKILEGPKNIDEITQDLDNTKNISSALMLLEIKGYIRKTSGYKYTVSKVQ